VIKVSNFEQKNFCVCTPYIIPDYLNKKMNAGDGFIYDSSIKLIKYNPRFVFSSREELDEKKIEMINSCKLLVVTGANIIKDNFEIITSFDQKTLDKIKVPIALMGIGHYGVDDTNKFGFDENSKLLTKKILERFPYISVRCNGSYDYMKKSLDNSSLKQIINTSCPVIFKTENVDKKFLKKDIYEHLVVTITDRAMLKQQLPILKFASQFFKHKRKILSLHQNYENHKLETFVKNMGFEIFKSNDYKSYIDLYLKCDLHFGNRVHAHLKCLSLGIPSFCTPFDLRQLFFSRSIQLPLITNDKQDNLKNFSFNKFIDHQKKAQFYMNKFLSNILKVLN
jgi:polysaccharide pyruvyl transferase WcaK-like protein